MGGYTILRLISYLVPEGKRNVIRRCQPRHHERHSTILFSSLAQGKSVSRYTKDAAGRERCCNTAGWKGVRCTCYPIGRRSNPGTRAEFLGQDHVAGQCRKAEGCLEIA
jgi:hypothetical protein